MDARSPELRVLLLTPTGRDAEVAATILRTAGIETECCSNTEDLSTRCAAGAGAVLLAEEAILPLGAAALVELLRDQPAWSDLPIIMLTSGGAQTVATQKAVELLSPHGNVTLLERPVRRMTLVTAVETALRARRRQYAMREHLEERRALLDAAQASRAAAERANRAKDEFLAMLSHELRSPLQGLRGWIGILRQPDASPQHRARAVEAMDRIVTAQSQLVNDLLDVSRIAAGKLDVERRPLELTPLLRAVVDDCLPSAEAKHIELSAAIVEVGTAIGDAERLRQIFSNLLSNAIKFTPEGGRVALDCRRDDGHVEISVADTGVGISTAFLPHVFDRFTQADTSRTRRHGGLGLGLAIARDLVALHGGTITAHSEGEGRGARFIVRLPLAPALRAPGPMPATDGRRGTPLLGTRVLLVEDDPDALEALTLVLRHSGAVVVPASSAEAAISAFESAPPDVLVSDISMPDEDGYSLLRRVRAAERDAHPTPAVALTGFATPADRARTAAAGFQAHLAKPVDPDLLITTLHALIDDERRSFPSPLAGEGQEGG